MTRKEAELRELDQCVDEFATEMKRKLKRKHRKGFRGWDNVNHIGYIRDALAIHVEAQLNGKEEEVDIANLAMMLWSFNGRKMA
jgi:hypothetical protein